jgi:hypothetical protein
MDFGGFTFPSSVIPSSSIGTDLYARIICLRVTGTAPVFKENFKGSSLPAIGTTSASG